MIFRYFIQPGEFSLLANRVMVCVLAMVCVGLSFSAIHFHSRYKHETQAARQLKSALSEKIEVQCADNQNLRKEVADLNETLEKTRIALALASRPSVYTNLPTPKGWSEMTATTAPAK